MLVARHIVEYHDWVWRGPYAAGSQNHLMNSPFYYYFIAVLWFFTHSAYGVQILWTVLLSLNIILAYIVGRTFWDENLGLLFSAFVAIHPELIHDSRQLYQPYVLSFFTLIFLWIFVIKRHMTITRLCTALAVLFLSLHFHYGSLLLLPAGLLWLFDEWKNSLKRKTWVTWTLVPLVTLISLCIVWVWLTYTTVPFDQFTFFGTKVPHQVSGVGMNIWLAVQLLFTSTRFTLPFLVSIFCFGGFVSHAFHQTHQSRMHQIWWLILYIVIPMYIAGVYGATMRDSYLIGLIPLMLFLVSIGLRTMMSHNRILGIILVGALIVLWLPDAGIDRRIAMRLPRSYFDQFYEISGSIASDYRNSMPTSGEVVPKLGLALVADASGHFDGWGTTAFWYFLEDMFHTRLIRLADNDQSYSVVVKQPTVIYAICDYRGLPRYPANLCVRMFRSKRSYLLPGEKLIYSSTMFEIWRFGVSPAVSISS
jgi:hypothetical protein